MNDKTLNVHMLGVFSIEYEDHPLWFERSAVSKTAQLLQMIFYNLDNGISKELLMDALYGRESVENRNGSLNNTIFRLRKQLEAAGLPKDAVARTGSPPSDRAVARSVSGDVAVSKSQSGSGPR